MSDKWCCPMRHKFIWALVGQIPDEQMPMPVEAVDFTNFDEKAPDGAPVLHTKYCPWCGAMIGDGPRHRTSFATEEDET